jgi:hypothetical protein
VTQRAGRRLTDHELRSRVVSASAVGMTYGPV